ncbi:MAG TPA: hypothetical protein VFA47_06845, partial [Candidatus Manganitrophaceae bacterium]|nr:hypothetical protein [Candidatus Manganitrophaceae bacterium]
FSSSSAVAAAAALYTKGTISGGVAGVGAVIASLASVLVNFPLVLQAREDKLTKRFIWVIGIILLLGVIGVLIQLTVFPGMTQG